MFSVTELNFKQALWCKGGLKHKLQAQIGQIIVQHFTRKYSFINNTVSSRPAIIQLSSGYTNRHNKKHFIE